eukprot:5407840-Pleurochrysis_carterae.AAC.2
MYDGVQMYKELKDKLNNLYDAHDADEHERVIECMRDELLPDNCSGQDFVDKVNTLIRDHNPYISVPYVGRKAPPSRHKVPTGGASWRRTRSPARIVRQERARQRKLRD